MRTTYIVRDGKVIEKPVVERPYPMVGNMPANFMVMGDVYHTNSVKSPVDLSVLDSRGKVREHNKRNDVVDIGNDKAFLKRTQPEFPRRKAEIRAAVEKAWSERGYGA